jgi:hypothetical protein
MLVSNPASPHGSRQSGPSHLNNTYSTTGRAWIENDVLLFEFENSREDAVTCSVVLGDDQSNYVWTAAGSVSWPAGTGGVQYVEFSGFPPRATGDTMDSCNFEATLTNDADSQEGTEVWMSVYRG